MQPNAGGSHRIVSRSATRSKSCELSGRFLLLAPIVVIVTFKAARLGAIGSRMVALTADANSWQKNVGCLLARARFRVTGFAGHEAMLIVIEGSVLKPAHRDIGFRHRWQLS